MKTKTTLDTLYLITDSNKMVTIEINVGDEGQTSALNISLEKKEVVSNHSGNLSKTAIGENKSLHKKNLRIQATIADTSKKTNVTSLNLKISGGVKIKSYPLYKKLDNEGDSADYYCNIEFIDSLKL
ncbi:hypothetical protein [Flavobacterium sp.]|uniref:hypothetical protein n=1 Tax=Flavobacterium sp. TaxID=239 RepID=UPI002ED7B902